MPIVTQVKTLQLAKVIERAMEQVKDAIIRSNIILDGDTYPKDYTSQERIEDYLVTITVEHVF